MLFYPFEDYEGFKEIFELREHGNGVKSRRNQILLAYYKSPKLIKWVREHNDPELATIKTMAHLKTACLNRLTSRYNSNPDGGILQLKDRFWKSHNYRTDCLKGKTEDGDMKSIRYVRLDSGKVYKMKAGKMYRQLILETEFGQMLSIQVVTWLCEELSLEWSGYNITSEYTLHVDNDFEAIYSRSRCRGDFGSCMTNRDHHSFYANSVTCKAAYLTDPDGYIVARAIVFTDVTDKETGATLRLCERQYSSECDDMLKQILVNKLIEGGFIDGYKRVGADCHNSRGFVDNNGNDLSDCCFSIECNLDYDDTLSYQDSFKWYNMSENRAYNYDTDYDYRLDSTDDTLDGCRNYDEYHDRYTDHDTVEVHYNGEWMTCDEDDLDDFVDVNGRYYHEDEVSYCEYCDDPFIPENDCYYSDITECSYCCESCMREDERRYCEHHPDEYVWLDDEAVAREDVIFCARCGECRREDDYDVIYSEITEEYYCCDDCMEAAEREYIKNHPDCGYAICAECDDVEEIDEMIQRPDGTYICKGCKEAAEKYSLLA